jgi:hypothetical protein
MGARVPLLPIRALRLVLEFVPCVVVTKVEDGTVRVCAVEKAGRKPQGAFVNPPRSIKKKGDTIVGRVCAGKGASGETKFKFAIWMGDRHGWVVAPDSDTDDHVLLSKISEDVFTVNCAHSHTLYAWDGCEFRAKSIPFFNSSIPRVSPPPRWYATAIHDRNRLLDYCKCGPDSLLLNTPTASFALFKYLHGSLQEMRGQAPDTFMFIMGAISPSQFLVSTYRDPYTYYVPNPPRDLVFIMTVADTQSQSRDPLPSSTFLRTPLQIRRMRAAQTFLIHHLSDYNVFVGDSDGCTCLLSLHPADDMLSVHYQCSTSGEWHFNAHQITLPDSLDYDKISVSHNRIHVFTDSHPARVLYSDFRLKPPSHTPLVDLVDLEMINTEGQILDVEISNRHGVLDWVVEEIEAIKERKHGLSM